MHLTIQNLSKQYRRGFVGLCDFDLEVKPGVIGLLGSNCAGKSTLMRMLATITQSNAGTIQWNGVDIVHPTRCIHEIIRFPMYYQTHETRATSRYQQACRTADN